MDAYSFNVLMPWQQQHIGELWTDGLNRADFVYTLDEQGQVTGRRPVRDLAREELASPAPAMGSRGRSHVARSSDAGSRKPITPRQVRGLFRRPRRATWTEILVLLLTAFINHRRAQR